VWLAVGFSIALFLFAASNQYGRLQFNSGVRYVVPSVPFLFLLAAEVLLKVPTVIAVPLGVAGTYWSWCLAMYRDVEQGLGVFESLIHISVEGIRFPWLVTLQRLGYVQPLLGYTITWILAVAIAAGLAYCFSPAFGNIWHLRRARMLEV
jgi:hypothetical protein